MLPRGGTIMAQTFTRQDLLLNEQLLALIEERFDLVQCDQELFGLLAERLAQSRANLVFRLVVAVGQAAAYEGAGDAAHERAGRAAASLADLIEAEVIADLDR